MGRTVEFEARLFELLDEASTWPEDERRQRAEQVCGSEPVSAQALIEALERAERLDDFLEQPAWQDVAGVIAVGDDTPVLQESRVGQSVGRFRLIEAIGRGGMGQVFLAEQDQPHRRVALKLIRSGGLSADALRRFSLEQQALARLNHPHIAQLYEADLTEDGEPYFAMEWIDGEPIDRYVRTHPLPLTDRLRLFLDLCSAIRHAHQKRIVHRDLKPSNVLVQEVDGEPVVKVIDFGIAEALDASEVKGRRQGRGLYGTPEYLSPEAFDGDVDTRSDVYSLGVLLYEWLTGAHPFSRRSADRTDLATRIRRGHVAPASEAAANADASEITSWAPRLRGDLDAVIAKAMHSERDRRYDSVADLAGDIERFLASKPVRARKADAWHLLTLFSRRRRATMIAGVIALFSVLAGGFGLGFGLFRAKQEAKEARMAAEEAEELSGFLTELFRDSEPNRAQGRELTARDLLANGRERLRSEALADQPLTRARLSRTIGSVYADLGDFEEAEALLLSALKIFEDQAGEDSVEVGAVFHDLGILKTRAAALPEAKSYYEKALAIQEVSKDVELRALALTVYHLGVTAVRQADHETARAHFERACPLMEDLHDEELVARCLEAFGTLLRAEGSIDEARTRMQKSLEIRRRVLGPDHPHVATSHASLCRLERQSRRFEDAEKHCLQAYEIRERSFEPGSHFTISSLDELAALRRSQGRFADAERLLSEQLNHIRLRQGQDQWREPMTLERLGWMHWVLGRYEEAEQRYTEVLTFFDEPEASDANTGISAVRGLGLARWKLGRLSEAEGLLRQAQKAYLERFGPENSSAGWIQWGLAGVLRDRADPARKDLERAGELYPKAIEILARSYDEGHPYLEMLRSDYREYLSKTSSLTSSSPTSSASSSTTSPSPASSASQSRPSVPRSGSGG